MCAISQCCAYSQTSMGQRTKEGNTLERGGMGRDNIVEESTEKEVMDKKETKGRNEKKKVTVRKK